MSEFVVDASVAAKWFHEEEYTAQALSLLYEVNQLYAPDFLFLEMDSVICKWIRRGAVSLEEGRRLRGVLRRYPIQHHPFAPLLDHAFTIANQTGRSIYDCLYVALAVLLKCRVVTADRKLYDALANGPLKKHVAWVGDMK